MPSIGFDGYAVPRIGVVPADVGVNGQKWNTLLRRSAETPDGRIPVRLEMVEQAGSIHSVHVTWYYRLRSGEEAVPLETSHLCADQLTILSPRDAETGAEARMVPLTGCMLASTLREKLVTEGLLGRGLLSRLTGMDATALIEGMKYGFELETQQTDGASENGDNETVLDEEAWEEAVANAIRDIERRPVEWRFYIPALGTVDLNGVAVEAHDSENWKAIIRAANPTTLFDLATKGIITQYQARQAVRNIKQEATSSLSKYEFEVEKSFTWFQEKYSEEFANNNLVIGSDGSVDGFEFRTEGGLSRDKFMDAARFIFQHEHDIDTRCSFHLHVSLNRDGSQVPFGFDAQMKAAATEYLISRMADVPRSLRTRWADDSAGEYFVPTTSNEKYSFVHCHSFGTLEYRCFGNIQNAADAETCLQLATEATLHAVRVLRGEATTLFETQYRGNNGRWSQAMIGCLENGTACVLPSMPAVTSAEAAAAPLFGPIKEEDALLPAPATSNAG